MDTNSEEMWIADEIAEFHDELAAEKCIKQNVNYRYYRRVANLFVVYEERQVA